MVATQAHDAMVGAEAAQLVGRIVDDRYRVIARIGRGGTADVYEVEQLALGCHFAMKVLQQTEAANPHLARRFFREAREVSRLENEHVIKISDYGVLPEGHPYFVMALLRGQTLRALLLVEPRLPLVRIANLALGICLGLAAAHARGLVHRDLKPENLWLTTGADGREKCVLLDFGVARFDDVHTTRDGALVGTARYMAPEQISSEEGAGKRSDLFALAVIIYECLSGQSPFAADTLERTLFKIVHEPVTPLSDHGSDVPPEFWPLLERGLRKDPMERYDSSLHFADALRAFAGDRANGAAPASFQTVDDTLAHLSPQEQPRTRSSLSISRPKRVPPFALLGAALGVGVGIGGTLMVTGSGRSARPESPAADQASKSRGGVERSATPALTAWPTPTQVAVSATAASDPSANPNKHPSPRKTGDRESTPRRVAIPSFEYDAKNPYRP